MHAASYDTIGYNTSKCNCTHSVQLSVSNDSSKPTPVEDAAGINELTYVVVVITFYAMALMVLLATQIKKSKRDSVEAELFDQYLERQEMMRRQRKRTKLEFLSLASVRQNLAKFGLKTQSTSAAGSSSSSGKPLTAVPSGRPPAIPDTVLKLPPKVTAV